MAFAAGIPHHVFACRKAGVVTESPAIVEARLQDRMADWKRVSRYLEMDLDPGRLQAIWKATEGVDEPVNRDDRPILALAYATLSGWYSGTVVLGLLEVLERLPFLWVVLPLLLIAVRFAGRDRVGPVWLATAGLGFTAMAVEMVLIYMFQLTAGSVYREIALLSGCFMLGLPLGATFMRRIGMHVSSPVLVPVLAGIFLEALLLFLWILNGVSAWVLYPFNILMGRVVGAMFPAAVSCLDDAVRDPAVNAGVIDAADHFGAGLGALLAGSLGILTLGVSGTLLLCLAILGAAAVSLVLSRH